MKKLILTIFLILSCSSEVVPVPVEPEDTNYCKSGCEHLANLPGQDGERGCLESRPLYMSDGTVVSCEQFCTETQKNGRALSPKCWLEVKECSNIEEQCRR